MSSSKHYIWSAINKFGAEFISFVGNIFLARLLMPEDFGLVAMLGIFTTLSLTFSDSGFNDCLIRKTNSDKYDFGTVATYNMFVSIILYVGLFISAPLIADYFGRYELVAVCRVMCISILLKSFTLSGFVQLTKELRFRTIAIIHLLCSLIAVFVTVFLAYIGIGYWALALQPVIISASNVLLLFIVAKWKPFFCFQWRRFKEMFAYSSNLLLSYIVTTVGSNLYSFIIGKYYNVGDLGYYNQAHKMQNVPTQGVNGVVLSTSYPIIAKEKDPEKQSKLYESLFQKYNYIQGYVVWALISLGDAIFYILFSDKWLPSVPLFKLFMLISLANPIVTINSNIAKIQNKSNVYRNLAVTRSLLQVLTLIFTHSYSLIVIIIGQICATYISALLDMYFCGKMIGFTIAKQIKDWSLIHVKPFIIYLITYIICLGLKSDVYASLLQFIIFSVAFVIVSLLSKDQIFYSLINKLLKRHE